MEDNLLLIDHWLRFQLFHCVEFKLPISPDTLLVTQEKKEMKKIVMALGIVLFSATSAWQLT